jgi:hypothetical protein
MNLRHEVSKALVKQGFHRNGRMHQLRLDKEFSFWVDTGPLEKRADISPFVGVRHNEVERLTAEFLGVPKDDWVGTIGANLGYVLHKGYLSFEPSVKPQEVVNTIQDALDQYKPFLELEKLIDAWHVASIKDPNWPYREIVILILTGEFETALMRIEAARDKFCKEEDEICEQFKGFEQRALGYMKSAIKQGK